MDVIYFYTRRDERYLCAGCSEDETPSRCEGVVFTDHSVGHVFVFSLVFSPEDRVMMTDLCV